MTGNIFFATVAYCITVLALLMVSLYYVSTGLLVSEIKNPQYIGIIIICGCAYGIYYSIKNYQEIKARKIGVVQ
jgi:hypothetical protein